jgi:hypothetical protein
MFLYEWARKHNIPQHALEDLLRGLGAHWEPKQDRKKSSEQEVQDRVRLEASRKGCVLWRNNLGVTENHVRYGLCNDSPKVNARLKSHDLVGIRPTLITPELVGRTVGIFFTREIKAPGWVFGASSNKKERDREEAQLRWALIVLSMGGDSAFTDCEGSI